MFEKIFNKKALPYVLTAAMMSAALPAMADMKFKPLKLNADDKEGAVYLAAKMKEKGYFPFIMIGGDEKLRAQANAVAEKVGEQIPVGYVIVPDLDGEERHMLVMNIGKDGNSCHVHGFNGRLDSFRDKLQESVQQAYTGNCAPLVATIN